MKTIILCVCLVLFQHCDQNRQEPLPVLTPRSFLETVGSLPRSFIEGMAEEPTSEGALGRNKAGYFHVRFQLGVATLGSYATYFKSEEALHYLATAVQYSFRWQKPGGDFEIFVPESLQHLGNPEPSDLTSGTAFFGAALGQALVFLKQSEWYQVLPETHPDKIVIRDHRDKFADLLNYLKPEKQTLITIDSRATNRLFWDAACFYFLGTYLEDEEAMQTGIDFLRLALANQQAGGFFLENGGHDSSYNGVSLYFGTLLYTLLADEAIKKELSSALTRCARWQMERVSSNGQISTEGNTRVYPGGETFLGQEKVVAWKDTVLALHFLHVLSGYSLYLEKAHLIQEFYS